MARYLGSRCKVCRQLNFSVCGSDRCALLRRKTPPGMHPELRRKTSEFKKRLVEKQKLRFSYWVSEEQFRNYIKQAFKKPGIPGETLLSLLEGDWIMLFIASDLLRPLSPGDNWSCMVMSW
ncbi:MAG TPA: hypothetical protein VEK32_10565 [Thermodesulfobacteriota bacterium]|nr:hypothetical protein [Thermodesulfobacteriota bacterium]